MPTYSLKTDGDGFEQHYYDLFIDKEFPEYGHFWEKFVPPLTNRPNDIHFKDDNALNTDNHTAEDICIAQLHYSILRHLARVYEVKRHPHLHLDFITEIFVRLTGAQDIAFELLERFSNMGKYDPWLASGNNAHPGSRQAKQEWQKNNGYPLQGIRDYRNHLIHGRMLPSVAAETYYFPSIGNENQYFDWRAITASNAWQAEIGKTIQTGHQVAQSAWEETLAYFRAEWNQHLL
jgi:hypothetical protein